MFEVAHKVCTQRQMQEGSNGDARSANNSEVASTLITLGRG